MDGLSWICMTEGFFVLFHFFILIFNFDFVRRYQMLAQGRENFYLKH